MIDSHCHLDHEPMYSDLKNVIQRSKDTGLSKILSICTTKSSFSKITKIIDFDPIIYGTFGIHPHETDKELLSEEDIIKKFTNNKKIIGVGETGLDFYYNNSEKQKQFTSFKNHIEASIKLKIPSVYFRYNLIDKIIIILKYMKIKYLTNKIEKTLKVIH